MTEWPQVIEAPVLPCWYCEGKDGEGDPFDPQVHTGWLCEACRERGQLRARLAAAEKAVVAYRHDHDEIYTDQQRMEEPVYIDPMSYPLKECPCPLCGWGRAALAGYQESTKGEPNGV